jgi:hypothetical protein
MPLFTHQTGNRKRPKGPSIASRIKRAFHRTPNIGGVHEGREFIDHFRVMFLRSMIVLMIGVAWWVTAPALFLSLFPGFELYREWITNYHTTISAVYQFWQVVPEILLFSFSIMWTSGVLDMIVGNKPLKKVF